jgi:hypothetical protein
MKDRRLSIEDRGSKMDFSKRRDESHPYRKTDAANRVDRGKVKMLRNFKRRISLL